DGCGRVLVSRASLRVLQRAAFEEGEGVQRLPLAGVMPLEPAAGDSRPITGAAGAVDALTADVQPGPEFGEPLSHGGGEPPLGIRSDADQVIAAPGDDLQQVAQDLLDGLGGVVPAQRAPGAGQDRKSTRLNSSHVSNSYAVFCFIKK